MVWLFGSFGVLNTMLKNRKHRKQLSIVLPFVLNWLNFAKGVIVSTFIKTLWGAMRHISCMPALDRFNIEQGLLAFRLVIECGVGLRLCFPLFAILLLPVGFYEFVLDWFDCFEHEWVINAGDKGFAENSIQNLTGAKSFWILRYDTWELKHDWLR